MSNRRISFATQAVGVKPVGDTGGYTAVHGAQSVGLTTTFNTERYFELGQSAIYQNIEDIPDVQVVINRFCDGHPLVYHLATEGSTADTLLSRQNQECIVAWSVVPDTFDSVSGVPLAVAEASGLLVSSYGVTIATDGPATEDLTLAGNDLQWSAGGATIYGTAFTGEIFDNTDTPLNISESGGLQTRERVVFSGQDNVTLLPAEIPGITSSGTNEQTAGDYAAHVQSVSISTDLGREDILELGRKAPYFKSTIEVISLSGSYINAKEDQDNTSDQTIKIVLKDGTIIDLGTRNRLQSVEESGGDTSGGNRTLSFNYQTANQMTVTHPQNPDN
jgi:hypothetical protein